MRKLLATLALALAPAFAEPVLTENFDSLTGMAARGWVIVNHSQPLGSTSWYQGNTTFSAYEGNPDSYAMADFYSTEGTGTISTWLITPEIPLQELAISFFTRQYAGGYADRLQLRLSESGASTDIGTTSTDVGDFTELLLEINPTQAVTGYPADWTRFGVTTGVRPAGTTGRLAFRYFLTGGGTCGSCAGFYVGVDSLNVATPEPATVSLIGGGLLLLGLHLRRRRA